MRTPLFALALLAAAVGCNADPHNPQQVRQEAAATTATVASDVKAAAEGVRDGLHEAHAEDRLNSRINVNTAPRRALETLPGIDVLAANDIIRHRPYNDPSDLVRKGALSRERYELLADRIKTSD